MAVLKDAWIYPPDVDAVIFVNHHAAQSTCPVDPHDSAVRGEVIDPASALYMAALAQFDELAAPKVFPMLHKKRLAPPHRFLGGAVALRAGIP